MAKVYPLIMTDRKAKEGEKKDYLIGLFTTKGKANTALRHVKVEFSQTIEDSKDFSLNIGAAIYLDDNSEDIFNYALDIHDEIRLEEEW